DLDGAEADPRVALLLRGVELPHRHDRARDHAEAAPVTLLVERDGHAKAMLVVVLVGAVVEDEQLGRFDLQKHHSVVEDLSVWGDHVEAPAPKGSRVALLRLRREAFGTDPLREVLRLRPRRKDELAWRVE